MLTSFNIFSLAIFVLSILLALINFLSKKTFSDKEKNSPFECGFDPKSSARLPFSLQFFLIAIIFLIFDVEIVLLMPIMKIFNFSNLLNMWLTFNTFMIILILGLYHEWNQGVLNWLN